MNYQMLSPLMTICKERDLGGNKDAKNYGED